MTIEAVQNLVRASHELLKKTAPLSAKTLTLYSSLEPMEVEALAQQGKLLPNWIERIAARTKIEGGIIDAIIHMYISRDIVDYTPIKRHLTMVLASMTPKEQEDRLSTVSRRYPDRYLLLHYSLMFWDGSHLNYVHGDSDRLLEACLFKLGLSFETTVELLETSWAEQWAGYERLWRAF